MLLTTKDKIEHFIEKEKKNLEGGGEKAARKQHEAGKYLARERLELLFDPDTFVEMDLFAEHRCTDFGMQSKKLPYDGVVTGYGKIDGRIVFAFSQDFTIQGGTLGAVHADKICRAIEMAMKMGVPLIGINDGGGARIQEGVDSLNGYGKIFFRNTLASGVIPQISIINGPCAGGATYSPGLTDFIFMTEGNSYMFITGPQVIKAVTAEEVTFEELGGAEVHNTISGNAHFWSRNEQECMAETRRLLSFLPSNYREKPPVVRNGNISFEPDPELDMLIPDSPSEPYDVTVLIKKILDNGDFLEVQKHYARNATIGFGRIDGHTIGIVANQPSYLAGVLDINSSDKIARFVRFCDAFNIPLLTIVDTPGYLPGVDQEYGGVIRHGAKILYAYSEATVPKVTLITRKAYGGAYLAMCSQALGADRVMAWPTAEIAVMGPEGACNIVFRKEIEAAPDPEALRQQKIQEYRENFASPYQAAARCYIDQILVPRNTRKALRDAFEMLQTKYEERPAKKHGTMPL